MLYGNSMEDIDKLLEKYFEGNTSLEEESMLRNYFRQSDIDESHRVYAPLFNFFSSERKEAAIEKKKRKIPLYVWLSVAASILLLICVKSFYHDPSDNDTAKTLVYIDGKKVTDEQIMNVAALNSIQNISEIDDDVLSSQIGILDSFTE